MKKYVAFVSFCFISLPIILLAQNTPKPVVSCCSLKNVEPVNDENIPAGAIEDVSKRTPSSSTWVAKDGKVIIRYNSAPGNLSSVKPGAVLNQPIVGPTSQWKGGSTPSCLYPNYYTDSILITVPAGINIASFVITYAYSSSITVPIPLSDGKYYFSTPCGKTDTIGCNSNSPGICVLPANADFRNLLTDCITPSCNSQSFWLDAHLTRLHGGAGCDTTYIWYAAAGKLGPQYYFSAYITGYPIINLTKVTTSDKVGCQGTAKIIPSSGIPPYTYLWSPNNQTNDSIGNLCAGPYCCTVTDSKGCTDSICVTISNTAGIGTISNSSNITIFPDPNTGRFTISGLAIGEYAELYNCLGQKLNTFIADKNSLDINISGRANGVYLIRVLSKDESFIGQQKMVKIQ